ncbi:MAG: ORF1 protein [Anelloviridae sp.]|nr:MAG: ORF1 protein [Anelloviridae sp.]
MVVPRSRRGRGFYPRRRYHKPYTRRYRRWHPRRRWHRRRFWHRRRPRTQVLTEAQPRKIRNINCRGWEILGKIGTVFTQGVNGWTVTNMIKSNFKVTYLGKMGISGANNVLEANTCDYNDFCGGWGGATFTFAGLVQRSRFGMAKFSDCFEGFPWIRFKGAKIELRQGREVSYMIKFTEHHGDFGEYSKEEHWNTPGTLLNVPGSVIVLSLKDSRCCFKKRLKIRRPPGIEGWYDIDKFTNFILTTYMWTAFDPFDPLGPQPLKEDGTPLKTTEGTNIRLQNRWYNDSGQCTGGKEKNLPLPLWTNRQKYDEKYVTDQTTNTSRWWNVLFDSSNKWYKPENYPKCAPFLPPWISTGGSETLWMRYIFFFQVGGGSLQNHVPVYPIHEVDDPPVCTPGCPAAIHSNDFDSGGILTDDALARITRTRNKDKLGYLKCRIIKEIRKKLAGRRVHFGGKTIYNY